MKAVRIEHRIEREGCELLQFWVNFSQERAVSEIKSNPENFSLAMATNDHNGSYTKLCDFFFNVPVELDAVRSSDFEPIISKLIIL